jgi:hypothetical protein
MPALLPRPQMTVIVRSANLSQRQPRRASGTLHQHDAGDAVLFDRSCRATRLGCRRQPREGGAGKTLEHNDLGGE